LRSTGEGYVGKSEVSFKARIQGHRAAFNKKHKGCRKLNSKLRAHGWHAFKKECLYDRVPLACLNAMEITMISLHGTRSGTGGTGGMNLTDGGDESPMLNADVRAHARTVMQSADVQAKRQRVFASINFKVKVGKESKAVWDGYDVAARNARAEHMAAAARRGCIEKREAKMADMTLRKAKAYWIMLKNKGMEYAIRKLRLHPERYVGRTPIADVEEWWGPSFEQRRKA